jgi:hypothetical protein
MGAIARAARRALAAPGVFPALLFTYFGVLLVILSPVIATSVGADDSYWILQVAPESDGSFWRVASEPLTHAFDFNGQPRTTALGTAERRVIALAAIHAAVLFSVPPALVWAVVKVSLLVLSVAALALFLSVFRFRGRDGAVRRFSARTRFAVLLVFPLILVVGAKAETVGTINGWLFYPSFTYGPFVACLLISSLAIVSARVLQTSLRAWGLPVVLVMVVIGFALNLSYEVHAVTIPVVVLSVLSQPLPRSGSRQADWRGRLIVLAALVGSFTVVFVWVRWRIAQMACYVDNSCYSGSVIDFDPRTLLLNVIGALPGRNGELVFANAEAAGRSVDGPTGLSVGLAILAIGLVALLWASWTSRRSEIAAVVAPGDERRGLLIVAVIALALGVGGAMITGLSQRAVEALAETSVVAYRTGVLTWTSFAVVVACLLVAALITRIRVLRLLVVIVTVSAVAFSVAEYFPRNVVSAQINRAEAGVAFIDTLHREISLGDATRAGDARRCADIDAFLEGREQVSNRFVQSLRGAYETWDYFHAGDYCTTGAGLDRLD